MLDYLFASAMSLALNPHTAPLLAPLAATVQSDPVAFLVNYGVAGIVVVLLVTGKVRTKAEVDGLKEALAESREDVKTRDKAIYDLTMVITNHTLPGLTAVAERGPEAEVLSQVLTRLGDVSSRLAALEPSGGK